MNDFVVSLLPELCINCEKQSADFKMTNSTTYKWIFSARFRTGAYGWKSSRLAYQRLLEAVSEIKKVAKKDPVLGAEGAVRLMEKLWPALEHIDTSSGALGSAVNKALDDLIPVVVKAPVDKSIRDKWLERLWQAMADDGVDYLGPVGDRWGELCGSANVAGICTGFRHGGSAVVV